VAASNDTSLATFAFDSLGNCTVSALNGLTNSSAFDGMGNCLAMTYPSGRIVTRTYNALDEVATVSSSAGGGLPSVLLASKAYDGPGRLGSITRPNNVNTRLQWDGLANPANAVGDFGWGQVRGVNHQVGIGGTVIDRRIAAYDRSQNKTVRAQTAPFFNGGSMTTNSLGYDAVDRLTQFTRAANSADDLFRAYVLDGNGNRLTGISNGVAAPYIMDPAQPDPADFQMNQYTITPFVTAPQQYDLNGNLSSRSTATAQLQYTYDYADRLVSVADLSGGFLDELAAYRYDALGRRISKTLHGAHPPPEVVSYVYGGDCDDNDPAILEIRVNGALAKSFVLDGSRSTDDGIICAFNSVGQPLYYHCDELRNTLALTDAAGNVIERYEYDDFGLPRFLTVDGLPMSTNASPAGNPFLSRGMEWDSEAELYSGGFDPKIGRAIGGKVKSIRDNGSGLAEGSEHTFHVRKSGDFVLKKEEGGRHTPFHNKMSAIKSKEDVYVWKIKSKEDVYVWKIKTKEDVYVWKVKSHEDTYTWKVAAGNKKKSLVIPAATLPTGAAYASRHTKTGHVTLLK
jgi:YD repeat-containing protein